MTLTPIYLNCLLPCSGYKPVSFTQQPIPGEPTLNHAATTHISYWESKLEFPLTNLPPTKSTVFGDMITLQGLPKWTEVIVCCDLSPEGYRLRDFLLPHQLYIDRLGEQKIWNFSRPAYKVLLTVFPLKKYDSVLIDQKQS